jgi:NADH dehydrogenase FAD-containing subunit
LKQKKKVVIVGAGFAGLSALLALLKNKVNVDIKLIDKNDYFEYIPSLHLCLNDESKINKIRIPLEKYYSDYFVKANVLGVTSKKVKTNIGDFNFDYLIIASGSKTNTFNNKFFEKHTLFAKNIDHIIQINKQLNKAKTISVIGGGYAGVEIASILAKRTNKKIQIFDEEESLLRGSNLESKIVATNTLLKKGVELHLGKRCLKCSKTHVFLPQKKVSSDMHILTAGIRPNNDFLNKNFGDLKKTLQTKNYENVFVCGDVSKIGLLPTAHNAMVEGRLAGYNVSMLIKQKSLKEIIPKPNILGIALGEHFGVIPIGNNAYKSYLVGLLKLAIEKRIMFEFKRKIMLPL